MTMQLKIHRSQLLPALTSARAIVESRNTINILANVKIVPDGDQVLITSTDLDMEFTATVETMDTAEGEGTTVSLVRLHDFVARLGDASEITMKDDGDGRMSVSSGRARVNLPTLPVRDFPNMTTTGSDNVASMTGALLVSIFEKVGIAISTEETRYYLCGIFMHVDDGKLAFAATDGHKLRRIVIDSNLTGDLNDGMPPVIIGRKAVSTIQKIIGKSTDEITLSVTETGIVLTSGNAFLASKVIDATYPDYKRVMPKPLKSGIITAGAKAIENAIGIVNVASDSKTQATKIKAEADVMTFSMRSNEGDASAELAVKCGECKEVGVNARYLSQMTNSFPDGDILIHIEDAGTPVYFEAATQPDGQHHDGVVMPMRVS